MTTYSALIDSFLDRVGIREDVLAAFLIGSRARTYMPADAYSDLDMFVVTETPQTYMDSDEWLQELGDFHFSFTERTVDGDLEKRAMFCDGMDVDFVFLTEERARHALSGDRAARILSRGYRVLLDKCGLEDGMPPVQEDAHSKPEQPPEEAVFQNLAHSFWYRCIWTAKKLHRGELWAAKTCMDTHMRRALLKMIEHHTHVRRSWTYNTWYKGRFIDTWADPEVVRELRGTFSTYDTTDMIRALRRMIALFRRLTLEVAGGLGYTYPHEADQFVVDWLNRNLS